MAWEPLKVVWNWLLLRLGHRTLRVGIKSIDLINHIHNKGHKMKRTNLCTILRRLTHNVHPIFQNDYHGRIFKALLLPDDLHLLIEQGLTNDLLKIIQIQFQEFLVFHLCVFGHKELHDFFLEAQIILLGRLFQSRRMRPVRLWWWLHIVHGRHARRVGLLEILQILDSVTHDRFHLQI